MIIRTNQRNIYISFEIQTDLLGKKLRKKVRKDSQNIVFVMFYTLYGDIFAKTVFSRSSTNSVSFVVLPFC